MPIVQPEQHEVEDAAYYCWKRGGEGVGHELKDWLQAKQLVFIAKNYDVVAHHVLQGDKKEKLWLHDPRRCRYCRAVKPDNRGWKEAHALPESVGNKTIIAMDECTSCNDHFAQKLEDDFGKLLLLARVITRMRGKEGVPSFKTRKGTSRVDVQGDRFDIQQHEGDDFAKFDPEIHCPNTRLTMVAVMNTANPSAVICGWVRLCDNAYCCRAAFTARGHESIRLGCRRAVAMVMAGRRTAMAYVWVGYCC